MMAKKITFNKDGYDPFLDFLKAFAIICVLLGHTFPFLHETGYPLWYGMQVPLFVLIQVFHVFKKDSYVFNVKKTLQRILVPFLIVQLIPLFYIMYKDIDYNRVVSDFLLTGGFGPGSYYPWLYLQLALVLVVLKSWFRKEFKFNSLIVSILICEGFEVFSSLIDLPEWIHRLLPIRYFFLIYLGWIWVKDGIVLNWKTFILSLLSFFSIIYFEYFYVKSEPWIYDTAWRTHRWPCYFYVSYILCGSLYWIYTQIISKESLLTMISRLARCSYEIFLVQMIVIPFMPSLAFIKNDYCRYGVSVILVFALSIFGGFYFNIVYNRFIKLINK